ncbi:MAG: peptidoglycan editing factor PgeF [Peptostreptococcaceae bacterium]|nr:peptidoglycan editing factor PgeF [Peptostreptococcaceae bacterium]
MHCQIENKGREAYLQFSNLGAIDFLNHCVTTRKGGFSKKPFDGLNMGLFTEDSRESILMNYKKVADDFGYDLENAVFTNQVHGDKIAVIDESFRGEDFWMGKRTIEADGLITNIQRKPLIAFFADCAGIFIADPVHKAIGISHAGWKGTAKEIGRKTIEAMARSFGTKAPDCIAAVGPSIGPCCFEVEKDVAEVFLKLYGESVVLMSENPGRRKVDLWEANRLGLIRAGVRDENIEISGLCTYCRNDLFYSHRGDNGRTGRTAGIMEII